MELHRDSREYVRWPVRNAPLDATFEVKFNSSAWVEAETIPSDGEIRVLVAGPTATIGEAVQLPLGTTTCLIRVNDGDEIVVRNAGTIEVS